MPAHSLRVSGPSGSVEETELSEVTGVRGYSLRLRLHDLGEVSAEAHDLFTGLVRLRQQLDPLGYRLLVNGARRDVWASGMARDMGGGRRAYLLVLGKMSRLDDLVDIFDPAPESEVGTVEEQESFNLAWIDSTEGLRRAGT